MLLVLAVGLLTTPADSRYSRGSGGSGKGMLIGEILDSPFSSSLSRYTPGLISQNRK